MVDHMPIALGIDLGTTNSVAAVATATGVDLVLGPAGERVHPSVVAYPLEGGMVVGADARMHRLVDPTRVVYSAKRLIGQNLRAPNVQLALTGLPYTVEEGPNQAPIIRVGDRRMTVPEVSAQVLLYLKRCAERQLGDRVTQAVITVPANFTEAQRQATKEAGRLAGLEVLRLINEPTAAALAYGFGRQLDARIAVFDFGGGTFDISLLQVRGEVFEVLASDGDFFLGGDDLDRAIAERLAAEFNMTFRVDPRRNPALMTRLLLAAEAIKCHLSTESAAEGEVEDLEVAPGRLVALPFQLERSTVERLIEGYVQRTLDLTRQALTAARWAVKDVDEVVCVGGSTRIPLVRRRLIELFGREPALRINPDEVVAHGAAIQAGSLSGHLVVGTGMAEVHAGATPGLSPLAPPGAASAGGPPPLDLEQYKLPAGTNPRNTSPGLGGVRAPGTTGLIPVPARPLLLDVNPASLGIQTAGGFTEVLLAKNSPIPIEQTRVFSTAQDYQTKVIIDCCRGEARRYGDNEALGQLTLEDLPAKPRGDVRIEVTFRVDGDGILHVRAADPDTGAARDATMTVLGAPTR